MSIKENKQCSCDFAFSISSFTLAYNHRGKKSLFKRWILYTAAEPILKSLLKYPR